jgi:MGT family glycosyltransferase
MIPGRTRRTVAFFPEASFGAALNCVGIAQTLIARGVRPVFICHAGFEGVFADYGFKEYHLASGDAPAPDTSGSWQAFVKRHLPHFDLSPADQLETYVAPTWEAIVDTAIRAEAPLSQLLKRLAPDAIVLDNVVMFPAIVVSGIPWVRMVSCAETELPDPLVPPYLSGLAADMEAESHAFGRRYAAAVRPAHARLNGLREAAGLQRLPDGIFLEPSGHLNLLLTPSIVRRQRRHPLDPDRFVYLEGCVRSEGPYEVPDFPREGGPLVYASFGSLGAMDRRLMERMLEVFAGIDARFLVNAGSLRDSYRSVPDNVHLEGWYPQPAVVRKADLFVHHGGNNSFCEALAFGVPSLVIPYCWDGHDNARRAEEAGVGRRLLRSDLTAAGLHDAIVALLEDRTMRERLRDNAAFMSAIPGTERAADAIVRLLGSVQLA